MSDVDPMAGSALPMTMEEYEQLAARTSNPSLTRDQRLLDSAAGLAEEAGEVLGLVRKHLFMGHAIDVARGRRALVPNDRRWRAGGTARAGRGSEHREAAEALPRRVHRRQECRAGPRVVAPSEAWRRP